MSDSRGNLGDGYQSTSKKYVTSIFPSSGELHIGWTTRKERKESSVDMKIVKTEKIESYQIKMRAEFSVNGANAAEVKMNAEENESIDKEYVHYRAIAHFKTASEEIDIASIDKNKLTKVILSKFQNYNENNIYGDKKLFYIQHGDSFVSEIVYGGRVIINFKFKKLLETKEFIASLETALKNLPGAQATAKMDFFKKHFENNNDSKMEMTCEPMIEGKNQFIITSVKDMYNRIESLANFLGENPTKAVRVGYTHRTYQSMIDSAYPHEHNRQFVADFCEELNNSAHQNREAIRTAKELLERVDSAYTQYLNAPGLSVEPIIGPNPSHSKKIVGIHKDQLWSFYEKNLASYVLDFNKHKESNSQKKAIQALTLDQVDYTRKDNLKVCDFLRELCKKFEIAYHDSCASLFIDRNTAIAYNFFSIWLNINLDAYNKATVNYVNGYIHNENLQLIILGKTTPPRVSNLILTQNPQSNVEGMVIEDNPTSNPGIKIDILSPKANKPKYERKPNTISEINSQLCMLTNSNVKRMELQRRDDFRKNSIVTQIYTNNLFTSANIMALISVTPRSYAVHEPTMKNVAPVPPQPNTDESQEDLQSFWQNCCCLFSKSTSASVAPQPTDYKPLASGPKNSSM